MELQSDIELKETFNNASLLEFFKNYLLRKKYSWLHNIYLHFVSMNLLTVYLTTDLHIRRFILLYLLSFHRRG